MEHTGELQQLGGETQSLRLGLQVRKFKAGEDDDEKVMVLVDFPSNGDSEDSLHEVDRFHWNQISHDTCPLPWWKFKAKSRNIKGPVEPAMKLSFISPIRQRLTFLTPPEEGLVEGIALWEVTGERINGRVKGGWDRFWN
ncbi:hypothetical protein BT69DRAFT_1303329 [Atractiella rhizophila]|nr:hypothetical protein BT69DRAFT_1303329 [Atractiella rhizophila]